MKKFINILQFLTRITIDKNISYERNMGSGLIYFPLVGAIIGLLMTIVGLILSKLINVQYSNIIIATLVVFTEVVLTGGLHIDGFGDTFDGMLSYRNKDEILRIMKDPRLGTNGLLAVIFLILFKVLAIFLLLGSKNIWPIFLMPILGRYVCVVLSYKTIPARSSGMGNMFIGKCDIGTLVATSSICGLVAMIMSLVFTANIMISIFTLASIPLLYVFAGIFEYLIYKKIDGLTGDVLGCGIELAELIFLIYIIIIIG